METLIGLIIGIAILFFILNLNSKELGLKKIKIPSKIKALNSGQVWGIAFFDRNKWIKDILIFILKAIFGIISLLMVLLNFSAHKAKKIIFK